MQYNVCLLKLDHTGRQVTVLSLYLLMAGEIVLRTRSYYMYL